MAEEEAVIALLPLDLQHLTKGALRMLAQDGGVDASILEQILVQEKGDAETVRCLVRNPALSDEAFEKVLPDLPEDLCEEVRARQKALISMQEGGGGLSTERARRRRRSDHTEQAEASLQKRIQSMSPGEKIALALKGSKEARTLLIRDANKEISLTVLKNPKISESEIEFYAASTSVKEDIQREIAKNRDWCKNYSVLRALVFNPKTPVGVSIEKLPYIKIKDLQFLAGSRNIPSAVRASAKRIVTQKQRKPG